MAGPNTRKRTKSPASERQDAVAAAKRIPTRCYEGVADPGERLGSTLMLGHQHETPLLSQLDATVALGTVRAGHGIMVTIVGDITGRIRGSHRRDPTTSTVLGSVDVHGAGLFAALPAGSGALAEMLLPLKLHFEREEYERFELAATKTGSAAVPPRGALSFTLGARQLSHATLLKTLRSITSEGGDPIFVFEIRGPKIGTNGGGASDACLIGYLPTRCSNILCLLDGGDADGPEQPVAAAATAVTTAGTAAGGGGALATSPPVLQSMRYDGELPPFRRSQMRVIMGWLRWWLCGILFAAGCWAAMINPEPILQHIPPIFSNSTGTGAFRAVLPPHPTNMSAAFRLGGLNELLLHAEAAGEPTSSPQIRRLLHAAAALTGGTGTDGGITAEQLKAMLSVITEMENQVGLVSSVTGVFTFVNIMWAFAILGIALSIGPSVYHLLKPVRQFLKKWIEWCFEHIVLPTVKRLHRWGAFELVAFAGCYLLVLQGLRQEPGSGLFVTLTGAALSVPAMAYSTLLRGQRCTGQLLSQAGHLWCVACWAPLAMAFQSTLIGYFTVAAFCGAIGFGVAAQRLCIFIGFESKEGMKFACMVSSILTTCFVTAHIMTGAPAWLEPFAPAVSVLGNVIILLSLLIISSTSYAPAVRRADAMPSRLSHWFKANCIMAATLVAAQFVGHAFGLPGMANVGTVFTVIWMLDKYAEFHLEHSFNGWVLVLMLSAAVWRLSLLLHDNPQYVASLFQAF